MGLNALGRKTIEIGNHFHHIISKVYTINKMCHCWCKPWHLTQIAFVRFVFYIVTPSFFLTVLFGKKSLHSPHIGSVMLCSTFWEWTIYINYLEKFCTGDFFFLPFLKPLPFLMRTFKFYSLSKFQLYYTVL